MTQSKFLLLSLCSLLLIACGGSGGGGSTDTPTGSTETPNATPTITATPSAAPTEPVTPTETVTPNVTATATATATSTPVPTPTLPSDVIVRINAEDYSTFSDTTAGNEGGEYREDDVDITSTLRGNLYVGWVEEGERLGFANIVIPTPGNYQIRANIASNANGNEFEFTLADDTFLARGIAPNTGSWELFETVTLDTYLDAGSQTIEIHALDGGWNFDWIEILPGGSGIQTPTPVPTPTNCYQPDDDGVIVIEAESVPANGWSLETEFDGYQGSGYYCDRSQSIENELVFYFYIPTAGDYRLSVRNYQDVGDSASDQANDAWSELNDFGQIKLFTHAVNACNGGSAEDCGFSWNTGLDDEYGESTNLMASDHPNDEVPDGAYSHFIKPAGYQLDAGAHTLNIRQRSFGYCIDRIHVYPDVMLTENNAMTARDITKPESATGDCE